MGLVSGVKGIGSWLKGGRKFDREPNQQRQKHESTRSDAGCVVRVKPLGFRDFVFLPDLDPSGSYAQDMNLPNVPSDKDEDQNRQDKNMQDIKAHECHCA